MKQSYLILIKKDCINYQLPSELSVNKLIVTLDDFLSFSKVGWRFKESFLQTESEEKNLNILDMVKDEVPESFVFI